jgi:hypothetical protein
MHADIKYRCEVQKGGLGVCAWCHKTYAMHQHMCTDCMGTQHPHKTWCQDHSLLFTINSPTTPRCTPHPPPTHTHTTTTLQGQEKMSKSNPNSRRVLQGLFGLHCHCSLVEDLLLSSCLQYLAI